MFPYTYCVPMIAIVSSAFQNITVFILAIIRKGIEIDNNAY
jgi:hypothetical protein